MTTAVILDSKGCSMTNYQHSAGAVQTNTGVVQDWLKRATDRAT